MNSWFKTNRWAWALMLILAFGFRFYFGLHCPSISEDDDEVQIYLIGLKSFTTHTWPYFGTDIMGNFSDIQGQMAGALQGLLVSIPLYLWPSPESPYLFLNLLTFLAFTLLAWYCYKRNPGLSPWFIFAWMYIAPWTTHYSTSVINQSYSIVGAILFYLGFMETIPSLSLGLFSPALANGLMGFGLLWVMQLHMSWVMFVPFGFYSLYSQWKTGKWKTALGGGFLGALPLLALLIPTYWVYGFSLGNNLQHSSAIFNWGNFLQFFVILARFFSFSAFELPRFIGEHTPDRWHYLLSSPWLLVPGLFLYIAGIFQAVALLILWFFQKHPRQDWKAVKYFTLAVFLVLYISFWFSSKPPWAHRYYEVLPVAMIFSFYCWEKLVSIGFWRVLGVIFLAMGIYFQVGYALKSDQTGISVYSQYRDRMAKAIHARDYHWLGERRSGTIN